MKTKRPANAPWDTSEGEDFLTYFVPYRNILKTIEVTLNRDVNKFPNEVRAAASMVIILCREKLWPERDGQRKRDEILDLASKQLIRLKQLYETKGKIDPNLQTKPAYRTLLNSLDQETRILESRLSDPKPVMPNELPATWGDFWFE